MTMHGILIQVSKDRLSELVSTPQKLGTLLDHVDSLRFSPPVQASDDQSSPELPRFLTLEKAWDAMRILLMEVGPPPMAKLLERVVLGNQEQSLGIETGFGLATFLRPEEVANLADLLSACSPSAAADYIESGQLEEQNVHGKLGSRDLAHLLELLQALKEFYADAAREQKAMVVAIV